MSDPVLALTHALTEAFSEPGKPSEPEEKTTDAVLRSMLTENTGRHMLDSGGAYGRAWERNQGHDFDAEPEATADWRWGYVDITISVYHALGDVLDYHAAGDALFERWATTGDRKREPWLPLMEVFAEDIGGAGFYGDGPPTTVNTYNEESMLSQVLQYTMFTLEDDTPISDYLDIGDTDAEPIVLDAGTYVLLQIHGGCDVRGGYTQPRLFMLNTYDDAEFFDVGRHASIYCNDCGAGWHTFDCTFFEPSGNAGETDNFEDYDWIDLTDAEQRSAWAARNILRDALEATGEDPDEAPPLGIGYHSYPSEDTSALCPHCGKGTLDVGAH